MKKTALNFLVAVLLFSACRKNQRPVVKVDWTTYQKAYNWLGKQQDSAFFYFNQVTVQSRDSLQIAMAYSSMGNIQYNAGDFYGSQESFLMSLRFLNENDKRHYNYLAGDYNNLGLVRAELNDHDGAIGFYKRNLEFAQDSKLIDLTWNNIAYAYQQKKNYKKAITIYKRVLQREKNSDIEYARAATNYVTAEWLADNSYNASPTLRKALQIRRQANDLWGLNSSYAHLADYYKNTKPDSGLWFARKMYEVAQRIKSADDQIQALDKLIDLSPESSSRIYFVRYRKLNDSLQTARNAAKNQFALIRYNVEKAKADNLRLKQQNSEKEQEIFRQKLFLAIGVVILIGVFLWFRSRRQRLMLEADNRIRQDRLQLSQRVHDVVANGIYRVINEIDYSEKIDKNYLLGQLAFMYEQSRKISQDEEPKLQEEFSEKIHQLVNAFKSDVIKLALSGNEPELWEMVNNKIKGQLELVLQELLVNMSKHSRASQAIIDFEMKSGQLLVSYRDNGVGFPNNICKGKGLQNTENRIRAMGGNLIFGVEEKPGARLHISIPIN